MRLLVDECAGPVVARWLQSQGHDDSSAYDEGRGADDDDLLQRAFTEECVLITNDKNFGEMVFLQMAPHKGVILLRLEDERAANKLSVLRRLLEDYSSQLAGNFTVVTEAGVRVSATNR